MFALAALAVVSCGTQRKTAADNTVAGTTTAPEAVSTIGGNADGRLAFGLSLFNEAVSASGNAAENIVVSAQEWHCQCLPKVQQAIPRRSSFPH